MIWLLLAWCLVSVPFGVVVGRCIAAADRRAAAAVHPRTAGAAPEPGRAALVAVR